MRYWKILSMNLVIITLSACNMNNELGEREVWSKEMAKSWHEETGWLCGANFTPSTAINQLEMWQAQTFDTATINRELGWAESIGMNVMRVYLHHLAWEQDREGFKQRMDLFMDIASDHDIRIMFVFFDDCWNPGAVIGTQPEPVPGKHNSGWLQDPGKPMNSDTSIFPLLEEYMKDVMNHFSADQRIVIWDLYNEPNAPDNGSMALLQKVFQWARETKAMQPVTVAVWDWSLEDYNRFQIENSDIISYHNYGDSAWQKQNIDSLRAYERPLICSEYMARTNGSTFQNTLPLLREEEIMAINWGLVSGKTNTMYAWGDDSHPDGSEPDPWFHDIFRKNGEPYSEEEVALIKKLSGL